MFGQGMVFAGDRIEGERTIRKLIEQRVWESHQKWIVNVKGLKRLPKIEFVEPKGSGNYFHSWHAIMCLIFLVINLLSHNTVGTGNTIGDLFVSSSSFPANAHLDLDVGPTVPNNQLSRNLNLNANSLLALNSLVICQVCGGPVLSHNTRVGRRHTTGELAVTSSTSSFLTNAFVFSKTKSLIVLASPTTSAAGVLRYQCPTTALVCFVSLRPCFSSTFSL